MGVGVSRGGRPGYAAVVLVLFACTRPAAAKESWRELAESAVAGNKASQERLSSISFAYVITYPGPKERVTKGQYSRDRDAWRNSYSTPDRGETMEIVCKDGVLKMWGRRGGAVVEQGGRIQADVRKVPGPDPWSLALQTVLYVEGLAVTLDEIANPDKALKGAKRVRDGTGREKIVLSFAHESGFWEVTCDPMYNHAISKVAAWAAARSPDGRGEWEVLEFREIAPTVYFPQRTEYRLYSGGVPGVYSRTTFSNVTLNPALDAATFRAKFPRGWKVANMITKEVYTTDEDGKPLAPAIAMAPAPPVPTPDSPPESAALTETREEPRSWTRFILPGSLGLLAAVGAIATVRRIRRDRHANTPDTTPTPGPSR